MNEAFAIQGYSTTNQLLCVVDGADIYQADYLGNRKLIGKTLAAYSELEATTTEYYNKLVELGVIIPPKEPEEMMAQNSRIYEQGLQETIFDLKLENQSLKSNIFVKDQTDALAKQYAECCCEMNRRLDGIECSMLKRPNLYGVAATCTGQVIPNGALGALGTGTVLA